MGGRRFGYSLMARGVSPIAIESRIDRLEVTLPGIISVLFAGVVYKKNSFRKIDQIIKNDLKAIGHYSGASVYVYIH